MKMGEIQRNTLEVGTTGKGEVVINHPDLEPDENGIGHIIFSVEQARSLANLLMSKSADAAAERGDFKTTMTNYSRRLWSVIDPRTGMQKDRAATVLVREVRKGCDQVTQGAPIPEDLRGLYAQAVADKSGASTTRGFQFANIQRLIERIARLEAKNRELKAQLERMGKPVSNEEWGTLPWMNVRNPRYFMERKDVNALIAARASKEAHS
jgi:hypothetical protein